MKIAEICALLKQELYETGYVYGFFSDGKRHTPDIEKEFDATYYNLFTTVYRIQDPADTMREKIGTCIDAAMVMKTVLESLDVPYKIWLTYHRVKKKEHTILTFDAEQRIVYFELTPQSSKPWYGKEILYSDEQSLINKFREDNYDIVDITDKIATGKSPDSLSQYMN